MQGTYWSWRINRNLALLIPVKPILVKLLVQYTVDGVQTHLVYMKPIPIRKSSHQQISKQICILYIIYIYNSKEV